MRRDYGVFHVALKLLLRRGNKFLFLKSPSGKWDLPGGRIDNVEYRVPIAKALAREIREELGRIKYKLGKPLFQYKRLVEARNFYVFLTVYDAEYLAGVISLSLEHKSFHWIEPQAIILKQKDFLGREEYAAFKKYFADFK